MLEGRKMMMEQNLMCLSKLKTESNGDETKSWKKMINVAVSGAAGMISNHLLFKHSIYSESMGRSSRTLYVGNLPGDIREREVEDLFYKYGPVVEIDIKIPPRPPGFAFVETLNDPELKKIIKAKEEATSRKDILDKVEKWMSAGFEESWLDDYNKKNDDREQWNPFIFFHLLRKVIKGTYISWSQLLDNVTYWQIKWICPTAPTY